MVLILGLVLWAFEARILRGQALSLKNRDFVLAAKVSGESTWRIVFGEIMPNMISRIAAAFVLVFYIAILFDAGLEFLGFGDMNKTSWGATLYWAQTTRPCSRASGGRSSSPASRSRSRCSARVHQLPASTSSRTRASGERTQRRGAARRSCGAAPRRTCVTSPRVETPRAVLLELRRARRRLRSGESARARRRRRPRRSRGRDRRPRRRVRLRQDDDRERGPADPPPARAVTGGSILFRGRGHPRPERRGAAPLPLAQRLDGLPERDERAQPGDARRRPVRRHDAGARADRPAAGARAGGRAARARRHRPPARPRVPARALRAACASA